MKITISGMLGSGKSTVAKELSKRLGVEHFSTGDLMRQIAIEKGMSLLELSAYAESHPEIDTLLDQRQVEIGKTKDSFVIDGRLSWNFIPDSVKIFLHVDEEEGARRTFDARRVDEQYNNDLSSTMENIRKRRKSELVRYKEMYGVDYFEPKHYDLLIDTTNMSIDEVVKTILSFLESISQPSHPNHNL